MEILPFMLIRDFKRESPLGPGQARVHVCEG
jgi:hypothetical protein